MKYSRIIIKIGTSSLTQGTSQLKYPRIIELAQQIKDLQDNGVEVVLVTSGAIAAGREALGFPNKVKHIPFKQMLAAVGQPRLMGIYENIFSLYDIKIGQILLTNSDVKNRKGYINSRGTLESLLKQKVLPIVNENDSVATEEIAIGDNDHLSAMVANILEADLLVLLTDIDGIYDRDPKDKDARLIKEIRTNEIPPEIWQAAQGSNSRLGTGGMTTKLQAAEIARQSGTEVVIANSNHTNILIEVANGKKPGTWIYPLVDTLEARKRYLLTSVEIQAGIIVDEGAMQALSKGGSLLPVGILNILGDFQRGDVIQVYNEKRKPFALGRSAYSSDEIENFKGLRSEEIEQNLGYIFSDEVINHDDLVILQGQED